MKVIPNHAKQRLLNGELALGMGLRQARTVDISQIAKSCDFDWLFIDMEHNSMSIDTAAQICQAALGVGITPMIRVPAHDAFHSTRLLDTGAQGIVVPHVSTAEQARESLDLDAVLFMPAGSPAFKLDKPVTPAEDRYAMTVLATAANPAFLASRFEIDRPGVTYTADTLHALRDFYPPQVKLYFITGADAIIDIVTWHDAERIAEFATFIAATRPGFDIDTARARIKESGLPFDVRYIQIPALEISSTNIRKRVARGMSVRYLTSESVLGYIRKRRLYADLGQEDFE